MRFSGIVRFLALLIFLVISGNVVCLAADKVMTPAEIKSKLEARGVGQEVRIRLKDKTEVKGTIVSIGEDSCVIAVNHPDQEVVSYSNVSAVHKSRKSTAKKIMTRTVFVLGGSFYRGSGHCCRERGHLDSTAGTMEIRR